MCEGTSAVIALWRQGGVSCHCGVSCQGAPTQLNISLKSSKNVTTVISWTHVELEVSVYYLHVFFIRCPAVPMEVGGGRGGDLIGYVCVMAAGALSLFGVALVRHNCWAQPAPLPLPLVLLRW